MSQLKKVKEELSFIWGKKPIVYLITEDLDLVDMLFEYDPHFCPKDVKEGKEIDVDTQGYGPWGHFRIVLLRGKKRLILLTGFEFPVGVFRQLCLFLFHII